MPFKYSIEPEKWEDLKFTGNLLLGFEEANYFCGVLGDIGKYGCWQDYDEDFDYSRWECIDTIYKNNQDYELYRAENYFMRYNNGKYEYWADKNGWFKPESVLRCGFREIDFG